MLTLRQKLNAREIIKMKASLFLAASGAILASAGPLQKRVMETKVVEVWDTVTVTGKAETVTADAQPRPTQNNDFQEAGVVVVTKTLKHENNPAPTLHANYPTKPQPEYPTKYPTKPQPTTTVEQPPAPKPTKTQDKPDPPAPTSSPGEEDMQGNAIYWHNAHRANNSAPAVSWDSEIADAAQMLAATCEFTHNTDLGVGGYGQNLAMWGGSGSFDPVGTAMGDAVSNYWYNGERALYDGLYGQATPDMSNFEAWGHYSQMVWADSTSVGCAVQKCAAGTISSMPTYLMVCNYKPAGNVAGAYAKNVLPPVGKSPMAAKALGN